VSLIVQAHRETAGFYTNDQIDNSKQDVSHVNACLLASQTQFDSARLQKEGIIEFSSTFTVPLPKLNKRSAAARQGSGSPPADNTHSSL
jgi:hypothetical protein